MKFRNNGPVTYYIVLDTKYGNLAASFTNLSVARSHARSLNNAAQMEADVANRYTVLTYDQRGTR